MCVFFNGEVMLKVKHPDWDEPRFILALTNPILKRTGIIAILKITNYTKEALMIPIDRAIMLTITQKGWKAPKTVLVTAADFTPEDTIEVIAKKTVKLIEDLQPTETNFRLLDYTYYGDVKVMLRD